MSEELTFEPVSYRLTEPIVTARGVIERRDGFLVTATNRGHVGLGEVLPLPGWSSVTVEEAERALRAVAEEPSVSTPDQVRAGLELALSSAGAALAGRTLWDFWGTSGSTIEVNALIGGGKIADLRSRVEDATNSGHRTIKVKLGFDDDEERLAALADVVPPDVRVRLDPNGAWSPSLAIDLAARAARQLGDRLEYIEDPVATLDELGPIVERIAVPIGFDEVGGAGRIPDITAALARIARPGDVVVVKPALIGGAESVRLLSMMLEGHGLDIVLSSLYDGPVGLAAWCHLAARIAPGRAHGLGTAALIDHPDMAPLIPVDGSIAL